MNKIVDRLSMALKNLVSFKRTNWTDTLVSGTALTASQLNRIEKAVEDLTTYVNTLHNNYYYTVLYSNEGWHIYKCLNVMYIYASDIVLESGSWSSTLCPYTIPADYRPPFNIQMHMGTANGGSTTGYMTVFSNNGKIQIGNYGNSGSSEVRYGGFACYPLKKID